MENILAIILVLGIVAGVVFIVNKMVKKHRLEQENQRLAKETSDKFFASERKYKRESITPKPLHKESPSDLAYMRESNMITKREHDEAIRTQNTQSSSSLLSDLADVAMIVNTVHHWNDNKPHVSNTNSPIDFPREERSLGVTKSESSWGFDDSDSRKSVSSSMDTSPSYSSSSSDSSSSWSSSSDSGPSSDW